MRNPTQADVARMAGVSRGLVSLALAGRPGVSSATRRRIQDAADRLGYSRDLSAASLATGSSPVLGIILPNLRNPFFRDGRLVSFRRGGACWVVTARGHRLGRHSP